MKRVSNILAIASVIGIGALLIFWPVSYRLNLSRGIGQNPLSPSDSIHLFSGYRFGIEAGGMWFYNYQMPWRGGTVSRTATMTGWDFQGIYYRKISEPSLQPAYTSLRVSFWCFVLLFAPLPIFGLYRHRSHDLENMTPMPNQAATNSHPPRHAQ